MKILGPTVALATLVISAAAFAQGAPTDRPSEMLLEGTPPTTGAEVPSAPPDQQPRTGGASIGGIELETLDEAVEDQGTAGQAMPPRWVGLGIVDESGATLGEVEDVIDGSGGVPEALIVRRSDGSMETANVEGLTYEDGRLVADGTALD
ncbi:PRC-barrel domain-containing protein [Lutibaculum baratangense]|uniref:PRC-barrel domain-containing protein n=1 Tax=Lutibaculum baratangense AMV1 TaxID=631454 RepID=V4RKW9_9HYPH|nr:PRC-barrel domain-containing protein [Lutibaculum baratangense]ESR25939.1 hypothetical protein N177_1274 [Lutibaculum baratangense AMV1]